MPTVEASDFNLKGDKFQPRDPGVPGPSRSAPEPAASEPVVEESKASEKGMTTLAKTLEKLNENVVQNANDGRLLADPTIRAYLEAKSRGVNVKIMTDDQLEQLKSSATPKVEDPTPPKDFETMTNAELVQFLAKSNESFQSKVLTQELQKVTKGLREEFKPLLDNLAARSQAEDARRAESEFTTLKKEFADFDQVRPLMAKLNEQVQGLSLRELYTMSKLRAGLPLVTQTQIETERPNEPVGQRRAPRSPTETSRRGTRNAFQDLARSVLNRQEE